MVQAVIQRINAFQFRGVNLIVAQVLLAVLYGLLDENTLTHILVFLRTGDVTFLVSGDFTLVIVVIVNVSAVRRNVVWQSRLHSFAVLGDVHLLS